MAPCLQSYIKMYKNGFFSLRFLNKSCLKIHVLGIVTGGTGTFILQITAQMLILKFYASD